MQVLRRLRGLSWGTSGSLTCRPPGAPLGWGRLGRRCSGRFGDYPTIPGTSGYVPDPQVRPRWGRGGRGCSGGFRDYPGGTSGSLTCRPAGAPSVSGTIPGDLRVYVPDPQVLPRGGGGRSCAPGDRRARCTGCTLPSPVAPGAGMPLWGSAGAGSPRAPCAGDAQAAGLLVLEPHLGVAAGVLATGCSPWGVPPPPPRAGAEAAGAQLCSTACCKPRASSAMPTVRGEPHGEGSGLR